MEGKVPVETEPGSGSFGKGDLATFLRALQFVRDIQEDVKKHYTFRRRPGDIGALPEIEAAPDLGEIIAEKISRVRLCFHRPDQSSSKLR